MKKGIMKIKKKCYVCQKRFCHNKKQEKMFKLYQKGRDHCHFTGNLEGLLMAFVI